MEWHQLLTDGSRYLLNSGVEQRHIESYLVEPWKYETIRAASQWWKKTMLPVIREYLQIMNQHNERGWKTLMALNRSHPQIRALRTAQMKVRETWFKRPRWKHEAGIVMDRGY